jgi:hypothetical protein
MPSCGIAGLTGGFASTVLLAADRVGTGWLPGLRCLQKRNPMKSGASHRHLA